MEVETGYVARVLQIPSGLLRYFVALDAVIRDLGQEPQHGSYAVELAQHLPRVSVEAWTWLIDALSARYYTYRMSKKFYRGEEEDVRSPLVMQNNLRFGDLSIVEIAHLLAFVDFYDVACVHQFLVEKLAKAFSGGHMDAREETSSSSAFVPQNAVERVLLPLASARHRDEKWLRELLGSLDLVAAVTQCWPQLGPLVASGEDHTLFVARDGLWGCGSSEQWQMGFNGLEDPEGIWATPKALHKQEGRGELSYVVAVATGDEFSMALVANGELWSCGRNKYGQLGHNETRGVHGWKMVRKGVVSVSCGARHTLIVTRDNSVWACGDNRMGQLCLGDTQVRREFVALATALGDAHPTGRVLQISCGAGHSAILTTTGLWMCGSNSHGQRGDGLPRRASPQPSYLELPNVRRVHCGRTHTLMQTREGLWGFGSDESGELGLNKWNHVERPTPLASDTLGYDVIDFAGGQAHSVALTETGLWASGAVAAGSDVFVRLQLPEGAGDPLFVVCSTRGRGTTFVGATHGLYACGEDTNGQLGLGERHAHVPALSPVPITLGFEEHEKREATESLPEENERERQRRRLGGLLCTRCDRTAVGVDTLSRRYRFCSLACCHAHYSSARQ